MSSKIIVNKITVSSLIDRESKIFKKEMSIIDMKNKSLIPFMYQGVRVLLVLIYALSSKNIKARDSWKVKIGVIIKATSIKNSILVIDLWLGDIIFFNLLDVFSAQRKI